MTRRKKDSVNPIVQAVIDFVGKPIIDALHRSVDNTLADQQARLEQLQLRNRYARANVESAERQAVEGTPYQKACRVIGISEDDPIEVAEAVYKAKARLLHPDAKGGNTKKFQELSDAMDTVRKQKGKR